MISVLSEDGATVAGDMPELADDDLVAMMREMVKARMASARLVALQRQGRTGTYAPIDGQEATVVGAAQALDPATDWVVPQYRELVALGRFGRDVLDTYLLYQRGHPAGGHFPEGVNVFPVQIALAAQVPHAVGLAWGKKLQRQPGTVLVFFGDGASSEGDFYEAANLAGVVAVPVILMCVNNGWAISTPRRIQTAADSLADKAAGCGIPGVQVDGNDVLAVYAATAAARQSGGPALIEAVTYRLGPHTTADDPSRYVPAADLDLARRRDPIARFDRFLRGRGLWDDGALEAAEKEADAAIEDAVVAAEAATLADDSFFAHVYAEPTPRMLRQREEMRWRS